MKRSPGWSFLSVFKVEQTDGLYLWRLRIFECPWFGIYLHAIHKPDHGRDLHDHPWPFVSIVLRGSYKEIVPITRPGPWTMAIGMRDYPIAMREIHRFNFKRADDLHMIVSISRRPTWTLVLRGPRGRKCGFLTDAGWVDADDYHGPQIPV